MPLIAVPHRKLKQHCSVSLAAFVFCFALPLGALSKTADVKADITSVLNMQAEAWNQGDLAKFMSAYLNSDETSFTSGGTQVWGYQALSDRYQKKYGKSSETMGKVQFTDLKFIALGQKNELVIGNWHLELKTTNLGGVFSLVLVKTKDGWKILHDHTSISADQKLNSGS